MTIASDVSITQSAAEYFTRILDEQDDPGLALRMRVANPGTARADCQIEFAQASEIETDDVLISSEPYRFLLQAQSAVFLQGAEIHFEKNRFGGQLVVKAPLIGGCEPDDDAPLAARIAFLIEHEINPQLASHRGFVQLESVTEEGRVQLRFGGGCHGCGQVDATLRGGVEKTLRARFPEITGVDDVTDHASGENPYY